MGKKTKLILAILLLLVPIFAGAQSISYKRAVVPSAGGVGSQPPIWSDNSATRGLYYLEEDAATTRDNAQGASDRDLTPTGSPPRSTTAQQGTYSNNFETSDWLECSEANCGGTTKYDFTGSFTFGCWAMADVSSNLRRIMGKGTTTATANSTGYAMARTSGSELSCAITATASNSTGSAFPVSTWVHSVCRYDSTNLRPYINGVAVGSNTAVSTLSDLNTVFRIGARADNNTANQTWDGLLDECFLVDGALTDAQICRITRCGFDGEFCVCDSGTPANYKTCYTDLDCKEFSSFGKCGPEGTCTGRAYGTCAGGTSSGDACGSDVDCPSSTCTECTLPSCNDSGP